MKISKAAFKKILDETLADVTPPNGDMALVERAREDAMRMFEEAQTQDDLIRTFGREGLLSLLLGRKMRERTDDPSATVADALSGRDIKDVFEAVALAHIDDNEGGSQIH
jgi:hypothetical protein